MNQQTSAIFYGWVLFICGALFYGYEYALRIMPSLVMPEILVHFNTGHAGFGYLAASYYYAYVLFQVPAGILIDRYGAIRLMVLACLTCAVGALAFALTHIFFFAMCARFAIGAGSVFGFIGTLSIASVYLPDRYFPILAGVTSAFGTISAMLADIFLTHILKSLGWGITSKLMASIGVVLALCLYYFYRKAEEYDLDTEHLCYKELLNSSLLFLKDARFWLNATIGCLIYLPTTIFAELWGIPFLRIARSFSEHQAALAISFVFLGYTIGAPTAGYLSNYFHRQKLLVTAAVSASIFISLVIYLPYLSHTSVTVILFCLGFAYGSQSLVFAVAKDIVPVKLSGSILAFTNMVVMLGGVFLQPVVGHIIDFMGKVHHTQTNTLYNYQVALSVVPIGVAISAILSFILMRFYYNTEN